MTRTLEQSVTLFIVKLRVRILVPPAGLEPARPKARDFKSLASTNSAKGAIVFFDFKSGPSACWGSGAHFGVEVSNRN